MPDPTVRKKADLWREILAEAVEDEIDRAASVSVEQAEKELAEAGFDVAAERAKAEKFLQELEGGAIDVSLPKPPKKP